MRVLGWEVSQTGRTDLGGEVTDNVGGVSTPEGGESLVGVGALEAVTDAVVGGGEAALLDPGRREEQM